MSESLLDRLAGDGHAVLTSFSDGQLTTSIVSCSAASPNADLSGCHDCVGRLKDSTSPLRMGISACLPWNPMCSVRSKLPSSSPCRVRRRGAPAASSSDRAAAGTGAGLLLERAMRGCGGAPDCDTRMLEAMLLSLVRRLVAPDMSSTGGRCSVAAEKFPCTAEAVRGPPASEELGLLFAPPKNLKPEQLLSRLWMLRPAVLKALACTGCRDAL